MKTINFYVTVLMIIWVATFSNCNAQTKKTYYQNGKLREIVKFDSIIGKYLYTSYFENGKISSRGYVIKKSRNTQHYGKIMYDTIVKDTFIIEYGGRGLINDTIVEKALLSNYIKDGYWIKFHNNGKLRCTGYYINGMKEGEWKEYDESGNLEVILNYKKGVLNGVSKAFYKNGNIKYKIIFVNGVIEGIGYDYYENGRIQNICYYHVSQLNGPCYLFDINGTLISIDNYKKGKFVNSSYNLINK